MPRQTVSRRLPACLCLIGVAITLAGCAFASHDNGMHTSLEAVQAACDRRAERVRAIPAPHHLAGLEAATRRLVRIEDDFSVALSRSGLLEDRKARPLIQPLTRYQAALHEYQLSLGTSNVPFAAERVLARVARYRAEFKAAAGTLGLDCGFARTRPATS